MKKSLALLVLITTLLLTVFTTAAYSDFGSGVECVANEVQVIKSGIFGRKIVFSEADIKQGLCITDFKSITVKKLPSSAEGTLMLAGRRVKEGQTVKRKNLSSLVFIPKDKDVNEASFVFTVDGYGSGEEIEFRLRFTDKINKEPEIDKEYTQSGALKTQREIGLFGKLSATDTEGDKLEYIIIRYPENGTIKLSDKNSGEYVYTPSADFIGKDKFSFVVRDEWGNFSEPASVTVSVTERLSEVKYKDMENRSEYNSAVAMTAIGVMGGNVLGDGVYFEPELEVSRAEFVAMAMKACGIKADTTLEKSFFDDDGDIPAPFKGYVATAQRTGIISGEFTDGELVFRPLDTVTKYEAGVIMAKLTAKKYDSTTLPVFNDISTIPTWARDSIYTMYGIGVFENDGDLINGTKKLTRAEVASYLYNLIS